MVKLEPFSKADFSSLIAWVDCEETLIQFAGTLFSFPLTHQQLDSYTKDHNRQIYRIIYGGDNTSIGHAEIFNQDKYTAILCRILIGEKIFRGKGIGQMIVKKLLSLVFNDPVKTAVTLNVYDWNMPAIKCYEKTGFIINEGPKRNTMVNGKIWTSMNMTISKATWENFIKRG